MGDWVAVFDWFPTAPILVRSLGVAGMALFPRSALRRTGSTAAVRRLQASNSNSTTETAQTFIEATAIPAFK